MAYEEDGNSFTQQSKRIPDINFINAKDVGNNGCGCVVKLRHYGVPMVFHHVQSEALYDFSTSVSMSSGRLQKKSMPVFSSNSSIEMA